MSFMRDVWGASVLGIHGRGPGSHGQPLEVIFELKLEGRVGVNGLSGGRKVCSKGI